MPVILAPIRCWICASTPRISEGAPWISIVTVPSCSLRTQPLTRPVAAHSLAVARNPTRWTRPLKVMRSLSTSARVLSRLVRHLLATDYSPPAMVHGLMTESSHDSTAKGVESRASCGSLIAAIRSARSSTPSIGTVRRKHPSEGPSGTLGWANDGPLAPRRSNARSRASPTCPFVSRSRVRASVVRLGGNSRAARWFVRQDGSCGERVRARARFGVAKVRARPVPPYVLADPVAIHAPLCVTPCCEARPSCRSARGNAAATRPRPSADSDLANACSA